jgi:hypothetical protein
VRIEPGSLRPGIEDSKIRRGISTGPRTPLPAFIVAGDLTIRERLHEVAFAPWPVDKQIFGEKHGNNHAGLVRHEAGLLELSRSSIYNGKTSFASAPSLKMCSLSGPLPGAKITVELHAERFREVSEKVEIELTPDHLGELLTGLQLPRFSGIRRGIVADAAQSSDGSWSDRLQCKL